MIGCCVHLVERVVSGLVRRMLSGAGVWLHACVLA